MQPFALVLAGGGVAGIAWELGVLSALDAAGIPVADAGVVIGTSAGAAVGAQLTTGALDRATRAQRSTESAELAVDLDPEAYRARMDEVRAGGGSPAAQLQRIGSFAVSAETVSEARRREVVAARLPVTAWPAAADLRLTAIDTDSGELAVLDRNSGVELVDAVAASCAVPGIWPAVSVAGRRYMDGGMRSLTNADLAVGWSRVIVLVPSELTGPPADALAAEHDALGPTTELVVVSPDTGAAATFADRPLDPSRRGPALEAGLTAGAAAAVEIKELLA